MMKKTFKLLLISLLCVSCATTSDRQAISTTSTTLARIAVQAAATYYGGPAAGQLASAGLDALASVIQGYIGTTVPTAVVKATPGVKGVGAALVKQIPSDRPISQADVDKIALAAKIAASTPVK